MSHTHASHGHDHGAQQHDSHQHAATDNYTDLLDLDAEVLHDYWTAALDWVRDAAADSAPATVLDLGTGTGVGALGLAQRFPSAQVLALDVSPDGLARVRAKAADLGLAGRVRPVEADLDAGWPDLGTAPLDLTWASMSMHHMGDPDQVLRNVLSASSPGGLMAVAEFSQALRFLPDDLGFGEPGFESRAAETLGRRHTEQLPTLGSQWGPRLTSAGWEVIAEREFPIDLDPPKDPRATRYAHAWFTRLSAGLADQLQPEDQAVLAELLSEDGPNSVLNRDNLHIRGIRTTTLARRG